MLRPLAWSPPSAAAQRRGGWRVKRAGWGLLARLVLERTRGSTPPRSFAAILPALQAAEGARVRHARKQAGQIGDAGAMIEAAAHIRIGSGAELPPQRRVADRSLKCVGKRLRIVGRHGQTIRAILQKLG